MSDKLVTFKTYLEKLKTDAIKVASGFDDLTSDQAASICDAVGVSSVINALHPVEGLHEAFLRGKLGLARDVADGNDEAKYSGEISNDEATKSRERIEALQCELDEVRAYLAHLEEDRRRFATRAEDVTGPDLRSGLIPGNELNLQQGPGFSDYFHGSAESGDSHFEYGAGRETRRWTDRQQAYISDDEDDENEPDLDVEFSKMELPDLLTQIQAILNEYPDDGQIIKELVQNADDAKANEIKILYDGRILQSSSTMKNKYSKFFKAPALVVYNDAEFTEEDWHGIKRVYNSVKADDPLRVGRFGLGFKSVFHITDYPCIVSGEKMLFLNPLSKDSGKVCVTIKLNKLSRTNRVNTQDCLQALDGIFGFNKELLQKGRYRGTMFWFPLRDIESSLSTNIYSHSKILDLFRALHADSNRTMLFLRHIHHMSLYMNMPDEASLASISGHSTLAFGKLAIEDINLGTNSAFYCAEIRENRQTTETKSQKRVFEDTINRVGLEVAESSVYFSCNATVSTQLTFATGKTEKKQAQWLIVNYLHGGQVSDELRNLLKDDSLGYLPIAGIAAMINAEEGDTDSGHIFCYQPLPQDKDSHTGLPVHINAFFALTQNRRHVKWPTEDQILHQMHTDSSIQWNKVIATEILPQAYTLFIKELKEMSITNGNPQYLVDAVYTSIPNVSTVAERWQNLAERTLEIVQQRGIHVLFTANAGGQWVPATDALIACFSSYPDLDSKCIDTVIKLLLRDCKNVVCPPDYVTRLRRTEHNVVTPKMVIQHLRKTSTYKHLEKEEKYLLLEFILQNQTIEDIEGVELFPLCDGSFTSLGGQQSAYVSDPETISLFPGQEGAFISTEMPNNLLQHLHQYAEQGSEAVKFLNEESTADLIRKTMEMKFGHSKVIKLQQKDYFEWEPLLKNIWAHIYTNYRNQLEAFLHLALYPSFLDEESVTMHPLTETLVLRQREDGSALSSDVCHALHLLSVTLVTSKPEWIQLNLTPYLHSASSGTILQVFEHVNESDIDRLNKKLQSESKEEFLSFLASSLRTITQLSQVTLRKLKIFKQFESIDSDSTPVSIQDNGDVCQIDEYPVKFPNPLVLLSAENAEFVQNLGASIHTKEDIVLKTLEQYNKYTMNEQKRFILWLLTTRYWKKCGKAKSYLQELKFLQTANGDFCSPKELFDPTHERLQVLFIYESVFPVDEDFLTEECLLELKSFGLKDKAHITAANIENTCAYIDAHSDDDGSRIEEKAAGVLQLLEERGELLHDSTLKEMTFVPVCKERPPSYPQHLPYFSETCKEFVKPSEVTSVKSVNLVGSVLPVVECRQFPNMSNHFKWEQNPKLEDIVKHLYNMTMSYEDQYKSSMLQIITEVYTFLKAKYRTADVKQSLEKFFPGRQFVWHGDGFAAPNNIVVEVSADSIDLKPYLRPLPLELSQFREFFKLLGCFDSIDMEACLKALKQIKNDSESGNPQTSHLVMKNVSIAILNKLTSDHSDNLAENESEIYVPIETKDGLTQLRTPSECVYSNASWLKDEVDEDDEEEIVFVHKDLSVATAEALGVPSLTQKVFADSDAMEEWGQEEPLTRRLKTILEDGYVDGFSIPKELFQNADDAKASKMWMLYDERENENAKKNLLSAGMAKWQGPAIWVYNDAEFTEDDFKNITKLSGATKESDPCTIGKFGLGFCAVYNLTDVPSLISGENIVIFDPHMKNLGKALPGSSPGLKINVCKMKSPTLAKKLCNQFRPAENVFGCTFASQKDFHFHGTLFRFPLRRNQISEISDKKYTSEKVRDLFQMVFDCAANLLLFNSHVRELKVFHIKEGQDPSKPTLLYETTKQIQSMPFEQNQVNVDSVLREATIRKQKQQLRTKQLTKIETVHVSSNRPNICHSESSWLVSWATGIKDETLRIANEEEGAVPIGAIAVPFCYEQGKICPLEFKALPKGFYDSGHFFYFLPLPIEHRYPFHINAPLAVSNDRRRLRTATADDSDVKFTKWNEALLGDCVVEALTFLLQSFKHLNVAAIYQQFQLWPLPERSDALKDMVSCCFYEVAVHKEQCRIVHIFDKWLNITGCKFLHPDLHNKDVGKHMVALIPKLDTSESFVDLPYQYYSQLLNADKQMVQKRTIDGKTFVLDFLLPHLNMLSNHIPVNVRDLFIKHAILLRDHTVNDRLKEIPCIPTQPNGELQLIAKIVDRKSSISCMFEICEKRFALEEFMDEDLHCELKSLGMIHDKLSNEDVLDRARSVAIKGTDCFYCASERGNSLLQYLEEHYQASTTVLCELQSISFLPLMSKPNTWFEETSDEICHQLSCERHNDYSEMSKHVLVFDVRSSGEDSSKREQTVYPAEVKSHQHKNLIASVSPLAHCENIPKLAQHFGWNTNPTPEAVLEHFVNIVKMYKPKLKPVLLRMVISVYEFCSTLENPVELQSNIREAFAELNNNFVWSGNEFLSPEHVYVDTTEDDLDVKPFLKPLPEEIMHLKDFFLQLGCPSRIDSNVLLSVLGQLNVASESNEHSHSLLRKHSIAVLSKLASDHAEIFKTQCSKVYIPVQSNDDILFGLLEKCVYCNTEMAVEEMLDEDEQDLLLVHSDVPISMCKAIGIPSVTEKLFTDTNAMEEWGQEEPLTRRLRTILEGGYVDGFSVPKELFQNADDAGASKIQILYDERENKDARKNLLSAEMAEWQGPALWVYNDAEFTEDDFHNITKLNGATKESDPCKIGKFGLGFCAVYNLTDVPSLISGENVVMFDPHMKFLGKALPGKSPGMRINVSKIKYGTFAKKVFNQFRPAKGVFDCNLVSEEKKYFSGTLFRLPLRSRPSEISDTIYSKNEIKKLIDVTTECAANLLLFNANVKEIQIYHLPKDEVDPHNAKLLFESCKSVRHVYPSSLSWGKSILEEVSTRKKKRDLENDQLQVVDEVQITRKSCNDGPPSDSVTTWLVSWATGVKSETLALSYKQEGAIPLGSVALPVACRSDTCCPLPFRDMPNGFYSKGHFYFFLPLPIPHEMPFHINGQFAVSDNRRKFQTVTEDDTNVNFAEWNTLLFGDAVVEAVMFLFKALGTQNITTEFNIYDIWPKPRTDVSDSFCNTLIEQFYQKIVSTENSPRVFKRQEKWLSIFECRFLEPQLTDDNAFARFAHELFSKYIEDAVAVEIPKQFYKQLLKASEEVVMRRTVVTETFLLKYFLPYLQGISEDFIQVRDKMTKFAINFNSKAVDEQLTMIACIPTRPNGALKHIRETVDEKSKLAILFDEDEAVFIEDEFSDEQTRNKLSELGMLSDECILKEVDVTGRLKSVSRLIEKCTDCALERCFHILLYLEENIEQYEHEMQNLQKEPFLPVLTHHTTIEEEEEDRRLCVKHQQEGISVAVRNFDIQMFGTSQFLEDSSPFSTRRQQIVRPADVCSSKHKQLIESAVPIVECSQFEKLSSGLGWLLAPKLEVVVEHFHNIVKAYKSSFKSYLLPMITAIYKYLAKYESRDDVKCELTQKFADMQNAFVWFGDGFVSPSCIYVEKHRDDIDMQPFLRPLPSELLQFKDFFKFLGCFECIDVNAYLNTLEELNNKSGNIEEQHMTSMRRIAVNILNELKDHHLGSIQSSQKPLYFPIHSNENTFMMKPVEQCVFCDADWLNNSSLLDDEDELMFVHSDISNSTAEALGVASLTDKVFSEAEAMEEWGQEEPLTRRLKTILQEGYVDGFSVPKELFQNADDAGAKKLWMLYDKRENEESKHNLLCEDMARWQGPALWVYNDAEFSEEDFRNIVKLSGATKESDSCTIGKFGLGFCAVYNLTDVPSFISGDSIVVFDPHMKYLGNALPGKSPGVRINISKIKHKSLLNKINAQFQPYEDVFGCKLVSGEKKRFNGTLFRFPLRTQESDISDLIYSPSTMDKFLQKTCDSAANMFLFNMNVAELKLYMLEKEDSHPSNMKLMFEAKKQAQIISNPSLPEQMSLLRKASEQKSTHTLASDPLRALQKVLIERTVHIGDTITTETSWLVSWATGIEEETLKLTYDERGAVPLGAVAVPYQTVDEDTISPVKIEDMPEGFYKTSHFFFFLPMPVEHSFPFHANAPFAVSSDRRKLRAMTDDDFEEKFDKWNRCLLGDSLVQAFIYLLQEMQNFQLAANYKFYELWPICEKGDDKRLVNQLPRQFYRRIFQSPDLSIFFSMGDWQSISRCIFLEPDLHSKDESIYKIAFDVLTTFAKDSKAVDLPKCYYDQLKKTNKEIVMSKTESTESFILTYFLKNIGDLRGSISESDRNRLTIFSICLRNGNVDSMLETTACIPTKPGGMLRHVEDTVDIDATFAQLFDDSDSRFPIDEFQMHEVHMRLKELGMMTHSLPESIVIEKAESISVLNETCSSCANERCSHLLMYLKNANNEDSTIETLKTIPFLPVKFRPNTWHAIWKSADVEENLELQPDCGKHVTGTDHKTQWKKPGELFHEKWTSLVGCIHAIIELDIFKESYDVLFNILGVRELTSDTDGTCIVIQQLLELSTTDTSEPDTVEFVNAITKDIYSYLERACDKDSERTYVAKHFHKKAVVWVSGVFTTSDKVSLNEQRECPPYLYVLKAGKLDQCHKLCRVLEICKYFEPTHIAYALTKLSQKYQEMPLTDDDLIISNTLLQMLHASIKRTKSHVGHLFNESIKAIYAPDENKILRNALEMCFDDYDAIEKSDAMIYVHQSISPQIAKAFGVKPKLLKNLDDISEDIEDFYQDEPLTRRISRLLEGYPCDASVFKELLQNADDAGASEVHIIFDTTHAKTDNVFTDNFKVLQGPALIVFNNKGFTQDDLRGIRKLGAGSKRDDPSKTGRYGVGFNAVYNLTDVPSFLTFGPEVENGETLCFFDPNARYIPGVKRHRPGKRYKNTESIHAHHGNVIDGYHVTHFRNNEEGTIFRLPLRSENMANVSDIKRDCVSQQLVKKMLFEFQEELKYMLLFLKKVQKVFVSSYTMNGLTAEYTLETSMSKEDENERNIFFEYLSDVCTKMKTERLSMLKADQKIAKYSLNVSENGTPCASYKVVQTFGFQDDHVVPKVVRENVANGNLGLLPYGGVALPLACSKRTQVALLKDDCRAFCFLPLPIKTGLPADIHGYFALSDETRRSLWHDDSDTCYKTKWNYLLIEHVITPGYISLLKTMKSILFGKYEKKIPREKQLEKELDIFYKIFPQQKKSDFYWKHLTNCVYTTLVQDCECFLPIVQHDLDTDKSRVISISWTPLYTQDGHFPAYFDDTYTKDAPDTIDPVISAKSRPYTRDSSYKRDAEEKSKSPSYTRDEILKRLGLRIVSVSGNLQESMKTAGVALPNLNPIDVIDFLCSTNGDFADRCQLELDVPVQDSPVISVENCLTILRYCKAKPHLYCQFRRMPLLISQQGNLKAIGPDNFMYLTYFPDLFPEENDLFVHKSLYTSHVFKLERTEGALKRFTIDEFVTLLERSTLRTLAEESITDWQKNTPTSSWIAEFWIFFWFDFPTSDLTEETHKKIEKLFVEKLTKIGHISLLPVIEKIHDGSKVDLVKVEDINKLIDLRTFKDQQLKAAFSKLNLRLLDTQCFTRCADVGSKLLTQIPNFNSPERVLHCLVENKSKVKEADITTNESLCILEYFFKNLSPNQLRGNISWLKQLPLFVTHTGERVDLASYQQVVVAPKGMPSEGLEFLSESRDIALLQKSHIFNRLEDMLSFQSMSVTDLYLQYIFPNHSKIGTQSFYLHVNFIFKLYKDEQFIEADVERLFFELSRIAFVEIDGRMLHVSNLFSYDMEIFRTFCKDSEFLPQQFREFKYLEFFTRLGLITKMNLSLFERFAKEVSQIQVVDEDAVQKSKLLAKSLVAMPMNFFHVSDLSSLSQIKFLIPEKIPRALQQLCPLTSSGKFICYAKSVQAAQMHICWTTCQIIPKYGQPKQDMCERLRISLHPEIDKFLNHCMHVGEYVAAQLPAAANISIPDLENVMKSVYKEFQRLQAGGFTQDHHLMRRLKEVPLVYFPQEKMLQKAVCVVIECHTTEEIPPYLVHSPSYYSLFNDVFLLLGAAVKPTFGSYIMVLKAIKSACGEEEMHPAELDRARRAIDNLVKYLAKVPSGQTVDCGEVFLPNSDNKMKLSTSLVVCNNNYIKKRLGDKLYLNYFIGFDKLKITVDVGTSGFMKLEQTWRPKLMKDVVGEEVILDDIKFQDNEMSRDFERFIHSDIFATGVIRLAKHALNSLDKKWTTEQEDIIISEMTKVRVRNVLGMKTVLTSKTENGRRIEGTAERKNTHIQKDQAQINIYIDTNADGWFGEVKQEFGVYINNFLDSCFKDRQFILLLAIIEAKDCPETIPEMLDRHNIDPYNLTQELPCSDFPKPGMYVPEKYHQYLDNDCGMIKEFDYRYMAYEVEDPLVEDLEDATPTYVFAEIKRKLDPESSEPLFQKYEVDIGEDDFIEAPAYKLYKFIRKDNRRAMIVLDLPQGGAAEAAAAAAEEDTSPRRTRNMKEVKKEIRKKLRDTWKKEFKGTEEEKQKERRRFVKRLLFEWHPDKNPDDIDFCTKVCQFIQQCVYKLEHGGSLPDDDSEDEESGGGGAGGSGAQGFGFSRREWGSSSGFGDSWGTFFENYERRYKRSREQNEREHRSGGRHRRNHHRSGFGFDYNGVWSEFFSYTSEARRWQRQAESDFKSAKECLKMDPDPAFNWICYKCHQAVEKALKAAWYTKDANHARLVKNTHDLIEIAGDLPGEIRLLTRQLSELTGVSRRMRYPTYSSIPADTYTQLQAREACELADKILHAVARHFNIR